VQTSDGQRQLVEAEVASALPLLQKESARLHKGSSEDDALELPQQVRIRCSGRPRPCPACTAGAASPIQPPGRAPQVTAELLGLVMQYSRFHKDPDRSDKVRCPASSSRCRSSCRAGA
jgi:hypothetical protein